MSYRKSLDSVDLKKNISLKNLKALIFLSGSTLPVNITKGHFPSSPLNT